MLILACGAARMIARLLVATADGALVMAGLRWRDSMGRTSGGWSRSISRSDRDKIAELMVRALYLYPHYRVDARGPRGCIWDVLTTIAPDVATEIENSDAATVYGRRWSER